MSSWQQLQGRAAVAAADAMVNNSYFGKRAILVSDMLTRAALAAADWCQHENK